MFYLNNNLLQRLDFNEMEASHQHKPFNYFMESLFKTKDKTNSIILSFFSIYLESLCCDTLMITTHECFKIYFSMRETKLTSFFLFITMNLISNSAYLIASPPFAIPEDQLSALLCNYIIHFNTAAVSNSVL